MTLCVHVCAHLFGDLVACNTLSDRLLPHSTLSTDRRDSSQYQISSLFLINTYHTSTHKNQPPLMRKLDHFIYFKTKACTLQLQVMGAILDWCALLLNLREREQNINQAIILTWLSNTVLLSVLSICSYLFTYLDLNRKWVWSISRSFHLLLHAIQPTQTECCAQGSI